MRQYHTRKKVYAPELTFTIQVFKEGEVFVAHTPELDVSSCGDTLEEAKHNLHIAISGFLKSAKKLGTLGDILEEAGFIYRGSQWITPQLMALDRCTVKMNV